jgi:PilZ domain
MGRVPGFIKRAPRIDLDRPAVLIDSEGSQQHVTVLDISSGGFKLKVETLPRIGDHVRLRVEGSAEIEAQIRWAVRDEAGGVFLTPVDYSSVP